MTALATGFSASTAGLRPQPFWLGIAYAVIGLALSALLVRDTRRHAEREARMHGGDDPPSNAHRSTGWVIATSVGVYRTWRDLGYAIGALLAGVVATAPIWCRPFTSPPRSPPRPGSSPGGS